MSITFVSMNVDPAYFYLDYVLPNKTKWTSAHTILAYALRLMGVSLMSFEISRLIMFFFLIVIRFMETLKCMISLWFSVSSRDMALFLVIYKEFSIAYGKMVELVSWTTYITINAIFWIVVGHIYLTVNTFRSGTFVMNAFCVSMLSVELLIHVFMFPILFNVSKGFLSVVTVNKVRMRLRLIRKRSKDVKQLKLKMDSIRPLELPYGLLLKLSPEFLIGHMYLILLRSTDCILLFPV